jgi:hypothetical protein
VTVLPFLALIHKEIYIKKVFKFNSTPQMGPNAYKNDFEIPTDSKWDYGHLGQ